MLKPVSFPFYAFYSFQSTSFKYRIRKDFVKDKVNLILSFKENKEKIMFNKDIRKNHVFKYTLNLHFLNALCHFYL